MTTAGPGVRPGERDEDDTDVALEDETVTASPDTRPADEATQTDGAPSEPHHGTASVAPSARDDGAADD